MRPFEADCYADGWRDSMIGKLRTENPYKGHFSAWDTYRERAWDMGWRSEQAGARWMDPREKKELSKAQIKRLLKKEEADASR